MKRFEEDSEWFQRLSHFGIERAVNSVFWISSEGKILHSNEIASDIYGYTYQELINLKIINLDPALDEKSWQNIWKNVKKNKAFITESTHNKKDGNSFSAELTYNFIEFDGEEYSCTFIKDITEQKKAEEDLRRAQDELRSRAQEAIYQSEDKFHRIFNHSNDAIFIIDPEKDKILDANTAASKLLGYSRSELFLMGVSDIHPKEMKAFKEFASKILSEKKGWTDELSCFTKSGNSIPSEISASTIEMEGKVSIIALVRDITERKKAEHELKELNEQLEKRVAERTTELSNANKSLKQALEELERLKNQLEAENIYLQEEIKVDHNFEEIITNSEALKIALRKVEKVSATDATVLILGETGTGKELFARAVHSISSRKDRALVKVNCSALPANLIESELFGHEKGAFTGAIAKKIGRFELADSGTIFLDEIGDLPLELQSKLLRVLQEGEFERLGNPHTIKINVRVIAATNRNLEEEINSGNFREDLYFRLNVFPLEIPPLRERKDDIPILANHFMKKYGTKIGKVINKVPKSEIEKLHGYDWPGNIRELENVIERAVILSVENTLTFEELPRLRSNIEVVNGAPISQSNKLRDIEHDHIVQILNECNWQIEGKRGASMKLGLPPTTLRDKMKKLGIKKPA
jgi:PAS domain S-box-containing protein